MDTPAANNTNNAGATADSPLSRRAALAALGAGGLGALASAAAAQTAQPRRPARDDDDRPRRMPGWDDEKGEFVLPDLPYPYDALEPHIDEQTMRIHHQRHHQGYVNGLNRALKELAKIRSGDGDSGLIKHWSREISFHGGGHINHTLFWLCMAPEGRGGGGEPSGMLMEHIRRDFGSFDAFKTHFKAASGAVEASGWGWLVYDPISQRLMVMQMEKQQDMLLTGCVPLMGVDVWEHAYYLKYQNRRGDYVDAFMKVVNWPYIARVYERARAGQRA